MIGGANAGAGSAGPACIACGSLDLEVGRPSWAGALRDWFRSGGPWRPANRTCRRCGHVTVAGSAAYLARREGWWRPAAHLLGVLRHRRSRVPVPRTYLLAAAVGTVLGAVAQVVLGWPWWLVATGVLAAVWLFFAASAFRGRGRPLTTDILMAVDPARGMRRYHQEMAEQFRAARIPLYGLPAAWPGLRHLGGWGSRQARGEPRVVTSLSLAHGDPRADHEPQLLVEVRMEPPGAGQPPEPAAERRHRLADDLRWTVAASEGRPPERTGPGPGHPGMGDPLDQAPAAGRMWSEVVIPVERRPVAFERLAAGRHWVAHAELGGRVLVLQGRDLDVEEVELARVNDVEPYIEGTRRLQEAALARARHPRQGGPAPRT